MKKITISRFKGFRIIAFSKIAANIPINVEISLRKYIFLFKEYKIRESLIKKYIKNP